MQKFIKIFTIFLLCGFIFSTELKTKEEKESYSIGASTGNYISNQLYNQEQMGVKSDINLVIEGFIDALKKESKLKDDQIIALLNQRAEQLNKITEEKTKQELEKNLKEAKVFATNYGKNPKVKTTKSGILYEILKQGNGEKPKVESIVLANYKATLLNGKVFDDTYKNKKPTYLSLINIIDGLSEGLLLMNVGSKYKFVIPSNLAYGDNGLGEIPPGASVIFEIELEKVFKPGELANEAKNLSESEIENFHNIN